MAAPAVEVVVGGAGGGAGWCRWCCNTGSVTHIGRIAMGNQDVTIEISLTPS